MLTSGRAAIIPAQRGLSCLATLKAERDEHQAAGSFPLVLDLNLHGWNCADVSDLSRRFVASSARDNGGGTIKVEPSGEVKGKFTSRVTARGRNMFPVWHTRTHPAQICFLLTHADLNQTVETDPPPGGGGGSFR